LAVLKGHSYTCGERRKGFLKKRRRGWLLLREILANVVVGGNVPLWGRRSAEISLNAGHG